MGMTGSTSTPFWAASGLGLAAALSGARSAWLGVFFGSYASAWVSLTGDVAGALTVAASDTAGAWLAAAIYRGAQNSLPWLGAWRNGFALFGAGLIVSLLSALFGANTLAWLYVLPEAVADDVWTSWFLGDSLGLIIAGPVFISLAACAQRPTWPSRRTVLGMLATWVLSALVLGLIVSLPDSSGWIFLTLFLPAIAYYYLDERTVSLSVLTTVLGLFFIVKKFNVQLVLGDADVNRTYLAAFVATFAFFWQFLMNQRGRKLRGLALAITLLPVLLVPLFFQRMQMTLRQQYGERLEQFASEIDRSMAGFADKFRNHFLPIVDKLRDHPSMGIIDWQLYLASLKLNTELPGLNAVSVVYPVKSEELNSFFSAAHSRGINLSNLIGPDGSARAFGAPGFEHFIATLSYGTRRGSLSGIDFSGPEECRDALDRSRSTGLPHLVVPMFQGSRRNHRRGEKLILFIPIFKGLPIHETSELRRQALVCWLSVEFSAGYLAAISPRKTHFVSSVYDGPQVRREALLFEAAAIGGTGGYLMPKITVATKIFERTFSLVCEGNLENLKLLGTRPIWGVLSAILAGLFLGGLVHDRVNEKIAVESQVRERTKELELANLALVEGKLQIRKLALVASEAKTPILLIDSAMLIEWANESFSDLYGYTLAEVKGKKMKDILPGDRSDISSLGPAADQFYQKGDPVIYEILHYTKAREEVWVSVSLRPVLDAHGKLERAVAVITDLREVNRAARQMKIALGLAEEASVAKSTLIANISHELRTPLNVIMGQVQLMQAGTYGPIHDRQQGPLLSIQQGSKHLLDLIGDLLDLSKARAGMLQLAVGPVEIAKLADFVRSIVAASAAIKEIALSVELRHQTNLVEGDELRLRQILINVVGNAIKFAPRGGRVTLKIEEAADPSELLFHVIDNGPGIAAKDRESIFREFEQGEGSGVAGGTGLGLAISRQLATLHKGGLTVVSEVGRGSTFTLRLPIRPPAAVPDSAPVAEIAVTAPRHSAPADALILAVDDYEVNLELLGLYLEGEGYRVILESSGEAAIAAACARKPNLILMDVKMAGMGGLEAIRQLKLNPQTRNIPVISLTAFAGAADVDICLAAGASDYLAKPLDFSELGRKIAHHLSARL